MKAISLLTFTAFLLSAQAAFAADESFNITIKDHQFTPKELTVPAGKKVKLVVKNDDATAEEFESYELSREKIISGNSTATIFIGPLEVGTYPYFGEFNPKTAQGTIIAK